MLCKAAANNYPTQVEIARLNDKDEPKRGMNLPEPEEVLSGGNINKVVKVGGTVRRAVASPDPYVHELLMHLEQAGYPSSPRYIGIDEEGREILSFLEGVVPGNDYPDIEPYMWSDDTLAELAKLLRNYHNATVGFMASVRSANEYPERSLHEVVCHNDAALYNIVFKDNHPIGLIDFDMSGPGPRIWDIAYTLYTSIPLASFAPNNKDRAVVQYEREEHAALRRRRIDLFFKSYGLAVPIDLKQWVISRMKLMCTTLSERAESGDMAFVRLVEEGHLGHYLSEVSFLEQHFDDWWN